MPRKLKIWPDVTSAMVCSVLREHCVAEGVTNLVFAFKDRLEPTNLIAHPQPILSCSKCRAKIWMHNSKEIPFQFCVTPNLGVNECVQCLLLSVECVDFLIAYP